MNLSEAVYDAARSAGADPMTASEVTSNFLTNLRRQPNIEMIETSGPRKAWDGTPDLGVEGWLQLRWERHDYHEAITWIRPVSVVPPVVPSVGDTFHDASVDATWTLTPQGWQQ